MDLWMLFMKYGFGIPPIDYARIGRWMGYFPSGRFVHANIDQTEHVAGEAVLGWSVHYAFGVQRWSVTPADEGRILSFWPDAIRGQGQ